MSDRAKVKVLGLDLPYCSSVDHRARIIKPYYIIWQLYIYIMLIINWRLLQSRPKIHHCTYNVIDMPGFLWAIPNSDFYWGPVGGGQTPPSWSKVLYGRGWFKQVLRSAAKKFVRFNPYIFMACYFSKKIFVANNETYKLLAYWEGKLVSILETAIESNKIPDRTLKINSEYIKLLWVGQIESRKGLPILLDALVDARLKGREIELDIIGAGPDKHLVENWLQSRNLNRVNYLGVVDFALVKKYYEDSDIFCFTSVQDTSGNVVLEAMSFGLPVIALNHQGASEILRLGGGVLVNGSSYEQIVENYASAIVKLISDPGLRRQLSIEAYNNIINNQTWDCRFNVMQKAMYEV
jgi:glycosyltransferase involved in cell wall biosynthesis